MEKKNYAARVAIYAMGLVILAAGITMNIKTGLGVSTYYISAICHIEYMECEFFSCDFCYICTVRCDKMIIKADDRTVIDCCKYHSALCSASLLNMFSKVA